MFSELQTGIGSLFVSQEAWFSNMSIVFAVTSYSTAPRKKGSVQPTLRADFSPREPGTAAATFFHSSAMFHQVSVPQSVSECFCLLLSLSVFLSLSVSSEVCFVSLLFPVSVPLCVGMHIDLTLLHSCTFCFPCHRVTELLCANDHSSNAFALALVAPRNRLPFDMVAER